jgi:arylformamidase
MKRFIDLSMMLHEGMQSFPAHWHPYVEITQMGRHGIENRETRKLILGTHVGSHIDAPRHFIPGGETVENIPLEQLNGLALLVDFSHLPARAEVDVAELAAAVAGRSVERLVLRFDGDKRLGTSAYYEDQPYISEAAAEWLVARGCRLLAMDVAQPDNPENGRTGPKDSPNHKILLGAGVILVEYLVNLKSIDVDTFDLIVAPLKIREGDGAPARCFAIIDDEASE